jgi:hypothetical protein
MYKFNHHQQHQQKSKFVQFNAYFNYLILGNIMPSSITFSFGLMAYQTVAFVRRELDKQLTVMVLVQ